MTDCKHISNQMPEVARGSARWNAAEERHLAGCAECRSEWAIVRRAARLGAGGEFQLDETAITNAVLRRLHTHHPVASRRRVWGFVGLVAAASVILLVSGRRTPEVRRPVVAQPES